MYDLEFIKLSEDQEKIISQAFKVENLKDEIAINKMFDVYNFDFEGTDDDTKNGIKSGTKENDVLKNVPKDVLKKLTDRQLKILELINSNSAITRSEMSSQLGVVKKNNST